MKFWFSYRYGFDIESFSTDMGWGCMHRTGQMMLAAALYRLRPTTAIIKIIKHFLDYPQCKYSIHRMIQSGSRYQKGPGEWLNPTTLALILRDIVDDFAVYVCSDCCLVVNEVTKFPCLLLIPTRLGIDRINPMYFALIKDILSNTLCVGIVGGRINSSLYFYSAVDEQVKYLDPHTCQPIVDLDCQSLDTFKGEEHQMPLENIDPSLLLCFLCQTQQDFNTLQEFLKRDPFSITEYRQLYSDLEEFQEFD